MGERAFELQNPPGQRNRLQEIVATRFSYCSLSRCCSCRSISTSFVIALPEIARDLYFNDPDDHLLEVITVLYGG